jgi:hypothetical protein|tara:strand:+ start:620 stop:1069 length:450 start_codon:yes stop_codon:yes gene_type:complete
MQKDNLGICSRCNSDACYEQDLGVNYKVYMCYGCGFTTNTLMTEGSEFLEEQLEVLPEIYKDLVYVDDEGLNWVPSTINVGDKGMIFVQGKSIEDWNWVACSAKELTEEEKPKFPEGTTHKMDMTNSSPFNERDFIDAMDYIGLFDKPE